MSAPMSASTPSGCALPAGPARSSRSSRSPRCTPVLQARLRPIRTGTWRRPWRPAPQTGETVLEVSAESDMSSTLPQSAAAARHLADLGGAAPGHRAAAPARRAGPAGRSRPGGACSSRSTFRVRSRRCSPAWPASGSGCRACSSSWRCCRSTRASGPGSDLVGDLAGRGLRTLSDVSGLLLAGAWAARCSSTWCSIAT